MSNISDRAERMLATDCGHSLEELAQDATTDDIARLIAVVEDPNETPPRLQRAIFIVGRMRRKEGLDPILSAVSRLDEAGRIAAADALGRIGGAKARDALIKLSDDKVSHVRKFAATGLARIGDTRAMKRLRQLAEEDSESFVRGIARKRVETSN